MRPSLAGASALLLLVTEAAGHAIPAAESSEIVARAQTYRANNGVQFAIETGFDHHGGDYKSTTANSLHDCINVCSTQASCRAVSYSGKTCWLKSSVKAAVISSKVSGAVRVQYVPTPITCPADGSSRVKGADGRYFTIQCGVDHPHGDTKSVKTLDFVNCISLCDETKGCVAASWRSGTCYLKKSLQPGVSVSGASTAVLSSLLPSGPVFCPGPSGQQIKETSGRTFTVSCNTDRPGSDLANKLLANFGDCIAWCDQTNGCVTSVYHDGRCWLKSKLTASSTRTNSQIAVLNSVLSPPPSLCPSQNGKQIKEASGRSFTVACNVDRAGGDMASKKLNNFNSCIIWCDQTNGCLAAVYHDGQCWLKKTLSTSSARANAQIAVLSSKLPQTSTSTSTRKTTSTSTQKTTSTSTQKTTSTSTQKTTSTSTQASSTLTSVSTSSQSSQSSTSATTSSTTAIISSSTSVSTSNTTPIDSSSTSSTAFTAPTEATTSTTASNGSTSTTDAPTSTTDAPTSASDTSSSSAAQSTTGAPAPSGTLQIPSGPLTLPAQPTVTLRPLAPPNIDIAGTDVITPKDISQLWFGSTSVPSNASDAINSPTIRVNVTFAYPSVILDNSINIINIQCDSDKSLSASFNGSKAYNAAKASWAATAAEGNSATLIIITAASGCSSDGHYIYFVASHFAFDDSAMSVSCSGSIESVSEIAQGVGIDFGPIETSVPNLQPDPALAARYGCTSPSTVDVHGLPAIYCGPDFDYRLDNQLGYYSVADEDLDATFAAVMPGVQGDAIENRGLLERRCWPSFACKAVAYVEHAATTAYNAVASGAKSIGNTIGNMASSLAKDAIASAKNIGSAILGAVEGFAKGLLAAATFIITGDYDRSFDFPVAIAPPTSSLDDSPWGDGFKFYTWTPDKGEFWNAQNEAIDKIKGVIIGEPNPEPSIELWCVDCHVKGNIKLVGSASYSILNGLTRAQLSMNGNLDAGLYLGMNAFAQWNPKQQYDFLSMGLPGLSIPDILVIGPVLSLGISVDLDVSAVGQYLVGADMNWPKLSAKLDALNPRSSSQSGWAPTIHDTVKADGSLTVNSTLGLPVSLGFGINILNGKYNKEIKLVDTPGVRASMEFDFTNEINNGTVNTDPENGCYGIHWSVGMVNTVELDLSDIKQGKYTLNEWDAPVFASGCIGQSLTIAPPTATVSAPSGGTTSVPPGVSNCGSLTCPNDDGKLCVANGAAFRINCGMLYQDTIANAIMSHGTEACTNACASDGRCIGINFFPQGLLNLRDCLIYYTGSPSLPAPVSVLFSFTKVPLSHKQIDLTKRVMTAIASSKTTVTDTLTTTALNTASTTASSTATSTDATASSTATSSPDSAHDTAPVTIFDATGQLLINPHVNGSLFVSSATSSVSLTTLTNDTTFVADLTKPLVVGDSASRILYYFPSTISAVGASRLRLGTWDAIPIGAEMIMLFPTVASTGSTVLVAMDSTQNVFYPFVCDIEGQLNKIFLVSDVTTGASTLMDPDLTYTVIGGIAQSCVSLAMVAENLPGWSPPKTTKIA